MTNPMTAPRAGAAGLVGQRRVVTARIDWMFFVLLIMSVWVPSELRGYPEFFEPLRYAMFVGIGLVIIARGRIAWDIFGRVAAPGVLALFITFCVISATWSDDLISSATKSAMLVVTFLAVVTIVMTRRPADIKMTMTAATVGFILCGVLVALLVPSFGVEQSWQHAGKWRGMSSQKNGFGLIAVLGIILLLSNRPYLPPRWASRVPWGAALAICGLALIMSQSRGAMMDLVVGFGIISILVLPVSLAGPALLVAAVMVLVALPFILPSLAVDGSSIIIGGHAVDTSSRLKIWTFGLENLQGRELLGFGYGGFWTLAREEAFARANVWVLPNFHNGYVSVLTEMGIVGSLILAGLIGSIAGLIVKRLRTIRSNGLQAEAALIGTYLVHNVYENSLTRSTDFFLILFLLSVLSLSVRVYYRQGLYKPALMASRPSSGGTGSIPVSHSGHA